MGRIPFGVERLDDIVGGGAPPGSVVLLVGEGGAGAREFLYTSAAMNGLAHTDPDLFELYYGESVPETLPPEVHYVSFTTGEEYIEREMANTMADEVVETALPSIQVRDLSPEYFQLSPVPQSWYADETQTIRDLGHPEGRESVLSALGSHLSEHAANNLVLVDSHRPVRDRDQRVGLRYQRRTEDPVTSPTGEPVGVRLGSRNRADERSPVLMCYRGQ